MGTRPLQVHYAWGGSLPSELANSVHVMKMCEAMAQLGHTVTLHHSSPGSERWSGADSEGVFAAYGIRTPFTLESLASRRGVDRHLYGLHLAYRIKQATGDVVVYSRFLPSAAWCSLAGLPTIHELHAPPATMSERYYIRALLAGRGFRKLVAITRALREELLSSLPPSRIAHVVVEPDGVNLDEYETCRDVPPDVAPLLGRGPLVGYIGSLQPGKGAELILRIARLVPKMQFMVVGGPNAVAERYRQEAATGGVRNVTWLGFRPNVAVPDYVMACDVVLLPNQHRVVLSGKQDIGRWTSPLKLFEYMAAGKIILASDLPVLAEILSPANAVLCDAENPAAWAAEIARIAAGESGYAERAARARVDVRRYAWVERARRCLAAAVGHENATSESTAPETSSEPV